MRRRLKIKTSVILFAWFVIFAHSIIPHNHFQENTVCCHEVSHDQLPDIEDPGFLSTVENQPEETNVCHFSNLLFNHFSQDNLIISTNEENCFYLHAISGTLLIEKTSVFLAEPYYGSSSMRAPPSA